MKLKLTTDDRNAIDLLMGEATAAAQAQTSRPQPSVSTAGFAAAADTAHVHAVRRVLQLLQVMPVSEPPVDLVSQTLARISQSTGQIMEMPAARSTIDGQQLRPA